MTAWLVGINAVVLALILGATAGEDDPGPYVVGILVSALFWIGVVVGARFY